MAIPTLDRPIFSVEILYDPGTPVCYLLNADDWRDALIQVRDKVGYNPGVPVRVTEAPINVNKSRTFYSGLIFERKEGQ